ncbi:MAG: HAMP domain-containing histidine kinase [Deltaproteobacteria bacterium]|nr:HAMP domain-containing histidine kinase [Deltaproteobacteria bacterium]
MSYVLLVAVPTVGLGTGWLLAARREEAGHERERRAAIERAADAVVATVSDSLAELRAREDARPYDLYNYYYAPADVLAAQEAVVVSPLAAPPSDPRILGWFQVDPTGEARSPSVHADAPSSVRSGGERVLRTLGPEALEACRGLAHGSVEEIERSQVAARTVRRSYPTNPVQSTGAWASQLATEIRNAQAGSIEEQNSLNLRGRAERPGRISQTWEDLGRGTTPSSTGAGTTAPRPTRRAVRPRPAPPMPVAAEAVFYTPMAFGRLGGRLALYRVVSSEGSSSVQGLLFDEDALVDRWLPEIAGLHAGAVARVSLVRDPGAAARCAVSRTLAAPLEQTSLCLEPLAASARSGPLALQAAALVGLVLLVVAGTAALLVAERRAARLAAMQREFVASVSHELRTPLTTLRMHAELLREGWVDEGSRGRFYDDLVVESTRLGQLVENVLQLSRLERGRKPRAALGDLGVAVEEAAEKRRRFVELKGFELDVRAPEARAAFDGESVDAIVANLLDNAVKYGAGPARRIAVEVRETEERAVVAVSDSGPGIPPADSERVFEQFFRSGKAAVQGTGTGLGLSLVRRLAREQGGDARVVSTPSGCTVEVWLPRVS